MTRCAALLTAMFVADALFVVTPADAQIPRDWMVCSGKIPEAQPDQQVTACTAVIEAGVDTPANLAVAYCARGVAYQARDQLDRAIADYTESIRIAPKSATSHRCRGFRNLAVDAIDDAIAEFNEAIALDPRSAASLESRGAAYRKKGDFSRALADYDEAIRLDPKNPSIFHNRGLTMIHLRNYGRAIDDLDTAIKLNPSYSAAFVNRGVAHGHRGEHDRAIADFTEAIRLDPRYAAAYTNRGVAYTKKGEEARATADFDEARRLAGRRPTSESDTGKFETHAPLCARDNVRSGSLVDVGEPSPECLRSAHAHLSQHRLLPCRLTFRQLQRTGMHLSAAANWNFMNVGALEWSAPGDNRAQGRWWT